MYLQRIDEAKNLRRYYQMYITRGLFGDWGLVREWGSIGKAGRSRTDWFYSEAQAKDARFDLQMAKAKRGYE